MNHNFTKRFVSLQLPGIVLAFTASLGTTQLAAGEWLLGGMLVGGRNPLVGDDDYFIGIVPAVAYRGERFHANLGHPGIGYFNGLSDFGGVGYSIIKQEDFNLDLLGKIRAMGIDPDEDDALSGLHERKPGIDFGVSARWQTSIGELDAQLLSDVSGRSKGQEAILAYAYPLSFGKWTLRPNSASVGRAAI